MTESLIGAGAFFHEAINPPVVVEPVETPFHLPTLARVAGMPEFGCEDGSAVVPASRNAWMDISGKQGVTKRVAVVSLVCADAIWEPEVNAINCAERQGLVVAIGTCHHQREKVSLRINGNTPFYSIDTMFSRVSTVFLAPFFDFTTDASR